MTIERWDAFRCVGGLPAERLYEFTTLSQLLFSQGAFYTAGEDIPALHAVTLRAGALYKAMTRDALCLGLTAVAVIAPAPAFVFMSGRVWMPGAALTPGRALYVVPESNSSNLSQSVAPAGAYGDYLHTVGVADTATSIVLRFHSSRFGGLL